MGNSRPHLGCGQLNTLIWCRCSYLSDLVSHQTAAFIHVQTGTTWHQMEREADFLDSLLVIMSEITLLCKNQILWLVVWMLSHRLSPQWSGLLGGGGGDLSEQKNLLYRNPDWLRWHQTTLSLMSDCSLVLVSSQLLEGQIRDLDRPVLFLRHMLRRALKP